MFTAKVYFFGTYRPAVFQAETLPEAYQLLQHAIAGDTDDYFRKSLPELHKAMSSKINYSAVSREYGTRGIEIAKRPHDPFLDSVTRHLPHYPGVDYSGAINT